MYFSRPAREYQGVQGGFPPLLNHFTQPFAGQNIQLDTLPLEIKKLETGEK